MSHQQLQHFAGFKAMQPTYTRAPKGHRFSFVVVATKSITTNTLTPVSQGTGHKAAKFESTYHRKR